MNKFSLKTIIIGLFLIAFTVVTIAVLLFLKPWSCKFGFGESHLLGFGEGHLSRCEGVLVEINKNGDVVGDFWFHTPIDTDSFHKRYIVDSGDVYLYIHVRKWWWWESLDKEERKELYCQAKPSKECL